MSKKLSIIVILLLCGTLSVAIFNLLSPPKIAFVHVQEVYNEFAYKKELEAKYDAIKNSRKRNLDSLEIQINALATNIQNSEFNKKENIQQYQYLAADYKNKRHTFTADNETIYQQYTAQIWSQLNAYIEEFGERYNYDMIYGADGSGSVMHGADEYNKTDELNEFVNERYRGGIK